jgi:hypothetical protein
MTTPSLTRHLAIAFGLAASLVLTGCAQADSDSLTEPTVDPAVTEEVTGEPENENLSPEIFPFAQDIPFTVLIDCNEQIDALLSEALGGEPTVTGLGGDDLAIITQQSGVGIDNGAEELFALLSEYISPASCMLDSGTGQYGQTIESEAITRLPDGMSGLQWTTRYVDAASESCDEYVERRAFWFLQENTTIHLTHAQWFGCAIEGEFSNEVGWEEVYEQAFDAHELLLTRLQ